MRKFIIPSIIAILFLGTAISPFLSTNVTERNFDIDFHDQIQLSENSTATRTYENDIYTLEISTGLESENYVVWLIRLSPFTHTNLGTLENGHLIFSEENPQIDYKTFTEIIITLESDPATDIPNNVHILEGSFN